MQHKWTGLSSKHWAKLEIALLIAAPDNTRMGVAEKESRAPLHPNPFYFLRCYANESSAVAPSCKGEASCNLWQG